MGVPAFFRWLTRKYPSVIVHCVEQKSVDVNGVQIPLDLTEPNPNGVEFDNLYLDMNGIIHPCTHPEDKPAPRNEDEMMIAIFECIDRLFAIVRPRKLLYMAIDGVAPRAKMNQQRSRRFRASKEVVEKVNEISKVRAELLVKGAHLPPEKPKEEHFDSNCITPGTPFMARLSQCLHYYVHERMNSDAAWRGIKVILSDANVPGEGEHKIMDYIRKQRAQPDHDPNTQHCLCGADADLIMLGLATHEPNFTIIREEFKPNKPRPCDICGQIGHDFKDCLGVENAPSNEVNAFGAEGDFIFVRLNVLREYLERELVMPNLPFDYDFERVIDDWVFMCFFVGNDFLPHLPSLEIREGAIDRLVRLYKDAVYKTGGFLTKDGDVNLDRVQLIMSELGKAEDEIFKQRQQKELSFRAREKAKKRRMEGYNRERKPDWTLVKDTQFEAAPVGQAKAIVNARQEAYTIRKAGMDATATQGGGGQERRGQKRPLEDSDDDEQAHDEVRLWEGGFKDRYYQSKFDVASNNLEFRYKVALEYVLGLCWVLKYYYQGCASWKWYFPYHYAPFASDFVNISGLNTEFEKSTIPFRPLEQLMGVFPAGSRSHVPEPWGKLMTDPESPIIDFYPEDFKIDLNGKKFAWQGVALLPFVEEKRLFKALKPYYELLTPTEIARNVRGDDRLYLTVGNDNFNFVQELYKKKVDIDVEVAISFDGMRGSVLIAADCVVQQGDLDSPVNELPSITDNKVLCTKFRDPKYNIDFIFSANKLKGAKLPPRVLKPQDLSAEASRNWRPTIGMVQSNVRATIGGAGHRMVDHFAPRVPGQYSAVPPNFKQSGNNQRYGGYQQQQQQRGYQQDYNAGRGSGNQRNYRGNYGGGSRGGNNYGNRNDNYNNYKGGGGGGGGYSGNQGYSTQDHGNSQGYWSQQGYGNRGGYSMNQNRGGRGNNRGANNNRGNHHQSRPPGPYRDTYIPHRNN